MPVKILLLGASGVPGRYVLSSLLKLNNDLHSEVEITVLKRSGQALKRLRPEAYKFLRPDIVVSALNAEPAPVLDGLVVDALLQHQERSLNVGDKRVFFINGYTLDLLHPSVDALPDSAKMTLEPKIEFAHRLRDLAAQGQLGYCTIVNAAFLDYCLVKGYSAVNLDSKTVMLVNDGIATVTGCSLEFVGDVVALVARLHTSRTELEREQVRNCRLKVADTTYSGKELTECVERITGHAFEVKHERSENILAAGQVIRYLNWAGTGAADFSGDGFEFGKDALRRRSLEELCRMAIENGAEVFEGVGR